MKGKENNEVSLQHGYQPSKNINAGYQPVEERGYQPSATSSNSGEKSDNPPSGGSSGQSSDE